MLSNEMIAFASKYNHMIVYTSLFEGHTEVASSNDIT